MFGLVWLAQFVQLSQRIFCPLDYKKFFYGFCDIDGWPQELPEKSVVLFRNNETEEVGKTDVIGAL